MITTGPRGKGLTYSPASGMTVGGNGPVLERRMSESWDKIKKRSSLDGVHTNSNGNANKTSNPHPPQHHPVPKPHHSIGAGSSNNNNKTKLTSSIAMMDISPTKPPLDV